MCPDDQTCVEGICQAKPGLEEKAMEVVEDVKGKAKDIDLKEKATKISEDVKKVASDTAEAGEEGKIKIEEGSKNIKETISQGFQKVKDLIGNM